MSMPGFTAEASLNNLGGCYYSMMGPIGLDKSVIPAHLSKGCDFGCVRACLSGCRSDFGNESFSGVNRACRYKCLFECCPELAERL